VIEVETACPPFEFRCKRLAGKFLLKNLAFRSPGIFNLFLEIYFSWRYVPKTMPMLSNMACSLLDFKQFIIKLQRLPVHEINVDTLSFSPPIYINKLFLDDPAEHLKTLPSYTVDFRLLEFYGVIWSNFPNSTVIFTDGSVSLLSAGSSFFIPSVH